MALNKIICKFRGEYSFLSNFYPSKFSYRGVSYPTVEHFFQAMKTLDIKFRHMIVMCQTPGEAKRIGQSVLLREDWSGIKKGVMLFGLWKKFSEPSLRGKLLETGSAKLIEGNSWHDNFWGDCVCLKCSALVGENNLGLLLMEVRKAIIFVKNKQC